MQKECPSYEFSCLKCPDPTGGMDLLPLHIFTKYLQLISFGCSDTTTLPTIIKTNQKAILPKCRFNQNMLNSVIYGLSDLGGIELHTLCVKHGPAQLQYLLKCIHTDGLPHKLAAIALTWVQLLAATQQPILPQASPLLPHLQLMVWIPSIQKLLHHINGSLELSFPVSPPLQYEYDCSLMDITVQQSCSNTQLKVMNGGQIYLGVTLLSNIMMANGQGLAKTLLQYNERIPSLPRLSKQ